MHGIALEPEVSNGFEIARRDGGQIAKDVPSPSIRCFGRSFCSIGDSQRSIPTTDARTIVAAAFREWFNKAHADRCHDRCSLLYDAFKAQRPCCAFK